MGNGIDCALTYYLVLLHEEIKMTHPFFFIIL